MKVGFDQQREQLRSTRRFYRPPPANRGIADDRSDAAECSDRYPANDSKDMHHKVRPRRCLIALMSDTWTCPTGSRRWPADERNYVGLLLAAFALILPCVIFFLKCGSLVAGFLGGPFSPMG